MLVITMKKQILQKLAYYYIKWNQFLVVRAYKIGLNITRSTNYKVDLKTPIDKKVPTIIASNHQTLSDSQSIFTALSVVGLLKMAPVRFMTWHKYYNGKFKFFMYSTGCYASHGEGDTGVAGAVNYANQGYRSFIYPEGTRQKDGERKPAYEGVSKILKELPEARLILVKLNWEKRTSFFSRPKFYVHIFEAPKNVDRTDPDKIMDAIYEG